MQKGSSRGFARRQPLLFGDRDTMGLESRSGEAAGTVGQWSRPRARSPSLSRKAPHSTQRCSENRHEESGRRQKTLCLGRQPAGRHRQTLQGHKVQGQGPQCPSECGVKVGKTAPLGLSLTFPGSEGDPLSCSAHAPGGHEE